MSESTIDKGLVTNLKLARMRNDKKPCFFALLVRSTSEGKLIVDKKKIPVNVMAEAKKDVGATMIVRGLCFGEDGGLVFETVKPPAPNWTALTKRLAKVNAGLTLRVLYRQGRDDGVVEESTAEGDDAPDAPGGDDSGAAELEAAWKQRVDAVTAKVKEAAGKRNPAARDMALGISQAGALFRGGDAAGAAAKLGEVEKLLDGAAPQGRPDAVKRFNALGPALKAALAAKGPDLARIQSLFAAAGGLLKNGDQTQANKVLDELEPLLKPAGLGGSDPAAAWKDALAAAQPVIKTALAAKGPNVAEIVKLFTQANALAKPGGDVAQALAKLKECAALASPQGGTVSKAPPPPPSGGDAVKRFNALGPALKAALAAKGPDTARIQSLFAAAGGLLKNGDQTQANKVLDELEPLVTEAAAPPPPPGEPTPGAGPPPAGAKGRLVMLQQSRLVWDATRKKVRVELGKLQQGMTEYFAGMAEAGMAAEAAKKLDDHLAVFDESLSDKLDEALNAATPEARTKHEAEALRILRAYRGLVDTDPLLKALDNNPITPVAVTSTLSATLTMLSKKLRG